MNIENRSIVDNGHQRTYTRLITRGLQPLTQHPRHHGLHEARSVQGYLVPACAGFDRETFVMSSLTKSVVHWSSNPRASMMLAPAPDLCEVSSLPSSLTICGGSKKARKICRKKPKYVENGFKHPFCGRTCARVAQSLSPNNGQCLLPGCRSAGRATMANFCSDAHGRCVAF